MSFCYTYFEKVLIHVNECLTFTLSFFQIVYAVEAVITRQNFGVEIGRGILVEISLMLATTKVSDNLISIFYLDDS